MFNSDGFADENKYIGLPALAEDAGHLFDMGVLGSVEDTGAASETESAFSPQHSVSSREGGETPRPETLRAFGGDPARHGQLSSNYPQQLLSPVASRRVRRSISPEVGRGRGRRRGRGRGRGRGRILNLTSPPSSPAGRGRGRAAGRGIYVLPAPARPRVTASSSGTARRPSQRPTRNQAAAGRTTAGNRARAAAQARAAAALIAAADENVSDDEFAADL